MATPFLGEIKVVAFNFAPKGWALCNGQSQSIQQNSALFSLFGTTYGGDGVTTFKLPDFQGRMPIHVGSGFEQGQKAGEESHTLMAGEIPAHSHLVNCVNNAAGVAASAGAEWGVSGLNPFNATPDSTMSPAGIGLGGGSQPHENRQPSLVLTFVVALQGIFPSKN